MASTSFFKSSGTSATLSASFASSVESVAASAATAASSASAASTSETNAASSAASALIHKNDSFTNKQNAAASQQSATASENAAATSAATATTKATEAATSATNAASSASSATSSASTASTSATAAQTAQTAAETSKTNAETAETNAETAETNAASSSTSASNSATAAASSATTASGNATTATTKASEAATSATNASNSASTATTKASEAATSASNALTSANNSAASATAAASSATSAAASATSATTAKTAAETAETNAETAETNAETAETNAATSATAAAASASTASGHATTATTKASEAATSATNASTSETNAATSATNAATSATAAASSATASASSATSAANSAAAAAAALDSFDDRYLGSKTSDPTLDNDGNALVSGALYFNSIANEMRVYDGDNWIAASSAGAASLILYEYTATSGQTTFSGADDNAATLSYSVGNIQVVMNGVVLDPSDFTATSGTSIVLATGATTGDLVNIYAFKSFTVSDTVSASAGGTFAANVTVTGTVTANQLDTDNIRIDGNTISSTDTNGNVYIDPDGTGNTIIVSGDLGVGGTDTQLFNGSGGDMKLVVIGDDSTTTVANNTDAGIAIVNTNQTANNLAGLHFARADTDDTPNYAGASIVSQFPEAQVTGQYPKGELAFLTSTATNSAPSEKMRISASGIITKPAQPAFRAYSSGSWTIATSTQTIFPANVAVFNVGSGYNTGTYKFTAPVDGVYYFAGQFFASVGSFRAVASLYKNDVQNQDNMGSQSLHLGSTANGGISYATHGLMQLDAGDTVSFYTYQETGSTVTANQSSNLSFWYGYLLG